MSLQRRWILSSGILILVMLFLGIIWSRHGGQNLAVPYVDFDQSMQTERYPDKVKDAWGKSVMAVMRSIYERAWCSYSDQPITNQIPRIIHQIWLGSPLPAKYEQWQESWKLYNPTWEYHLWTDALVEELLQQDDCFIGDTAAFYRQATNYGERSDILRLVLLRKFGGLYVDMDFECLRSCESLCAHFDFFIGMQPLDVAMLQLGSALIGATPHHPFIEFCIKRLPETHASPYIISRTGPIFMTESVAQFAPQFSTRAIVLPASYVYPRSYNDAYEAREQWLKPESYAVHHWSGSWLKKEAFVKH